MPPAPGINLAPDFIKPDKPAVEEVLVTPVREDGQDDWSRFEGASAAIGYFIRMVHDGRLSKGRGLGSNLRLQRGDAAPPLARRAP